MMPIWLSAALVWGLAGAAKPLEEPARIQVQVAPTAVDPGAEAIVTLRVEPVSGVKINRYPKIKLLVEDAPGVAGGGSSAVGNDGPPPPDAMETNYFTSVEPLELRLSVARNARPGDHLLVGKLSYFYCVAASGFCAPAKSDVKIPLRVR